MLFSKNNKKTAQNICKRKRVKITEKRTSPAFGNTYIQINYVTFEFRSSEKIELAIDNIDIYNNLFIGDKGTLFYQGKHFVNFIRKP